MADPSPSSALPPLRIMMAAGEVSGDMYGGALIRALRRRFPGRQLEICGIGGDAMRAEGAELLYHTDDLGAMGLPDVLKKLGFFKRVLRELVERAAEWKPDVLVTLDYYSFNIALAERVHALGVRTVQYISPKVWVWRKGRIRRIARAFDLLLCIFPFEPALYEPVGLRALYVGHPLVGQAAATRAETPPALPWRGRDRIAILPGSRAGEIRAILPTFLKAARQIQAARGGDCSFVLPAPTPAMRALAEQIVSRCPGPTHLAIVEGGARHVMAQAHAAMIASGTATLEACLMDCPAVLAYRVSLATELLMRLITLGGKLRFAGLVNIIAGRLVMTELLQRRFTPEATAAEVLALLEATPRRKALRDAYAEVRAALGDHDGTETAADAIAGLLG